MCEKVMKMSKLQTKSLELMEEACELKLGKRYFKK